MLNWIKKLARTQVKHKPETSSTVQQLMKDGFANFQSGNIEIAQGLFERILHEQPNNADALYLSGVLLHREGQIEEAKAFVSRAIASDNSVAAFHITLGSLLKEKGNLEEAQTSFVRAVTLDPDDDESRRRLAWILHQLGKTEEALPHLYCASRLAPTKADTYYSLGVALESLGRDDEALICYSDALELAPEYAPAGNNLGAMLYAQGKVGDAIACFRRTLDRTPQYTQCLVNLGVALQSIHQLDEAESYLLKAIDQDPQNFKAHSTLAIVTRAQGRLKESVAHSEHALAICDCISERVRLATLVPVIALSTDEISHWRRHFDESFSKLLTQGGSLHDPKTEVGTCNFNLAYQPECNKELQKKAAELYSKLCPELLYVAPHCKLQPRLNDGRIKVGFISKFMYDHSIGRTTQGILANLARDRFNVIALFVPPLVDDYISKFIRDSAENHLVLPGTLEAARKKIADLELDILFYQDIGMDAYTYFLAFSRLAPVQCVSFGHPDTTGIPNIDYWVSSNNFEPDNSSENYSEQLFLLRGIGTLAYYYRPTLIQPGKSRSDFRLPLGTHLYVCPQTLFKFHPDFDAIIANILRQDILGEVVLIEGRIPAWGRILRKRFQESFPDMVERVRFLPNMSREDFLTLISVCDVMLDTIYFNGMNTSLEAFAVGTPVVTMPTGQQRGRHTYGMYMRMELDECIASTIEEYVIISVKLGTNRKFRDEMKSKILSRSGVLFEDKNVVREFERFFVEAHRLTIENNIVNI